MPVASFPTLRVSAPLAAAVLASWLACLLPNIALGQAVRFAGPEPGISTRGATVHPLEDGRILIFGGGRASIWNPRTLRWEEDRSVPRVPRQAWHTAGQLADGRIVMIGGLSMDGPPHGQANALVLTLIWTPKTGAWNAGPSLLKARVAHASVVLPSNEILVIGGSMSAYDGRAFAPFLADVEAVGLNTTTQRKPLAVARAYHTASLLPDGRVMVIGGAESGGRPLASVEIYDPQKDTWSDGPDLHVARTGHTASVLPDGSVLVVGGVDADGRLSAVAERWNPSDNTWSSAGVLAEARGFQEATVLTNGDVLISGGARTMNGAVPGNPSALLELWRFAQARWTTAGTIPFPPYDHIAVRGRDDLVYLFGYNGYYGSGTLAWLPRESENLTVEAAEGSTITRLSDGRFLLAGGGRMKEMTSAAFVYDPQANRWTSTAPMRWARTNHRALLLRDGRVLVVGGTVVNEESREYGTPPPSSAAEVWDPGSGNWSTVQGVGFPSGQSVIPALLSDGHVQLGVVDHSLDAVYEFSLWDPQDGSVTDVTKVPRARPGGQLLTFPDGHLLYAGGTDQTQTRNTPRCTEDTDAEESDGDERGPERSSSDACTVVAQSAREGRRLDRWDPVTRSWSELPAAPVPLNDAWLFELEDGGMWVLPHPHDWNASVRYEPPKMTTILLWQPLWGWRTLPYPPGAIEGEYPIATALPKGEALLRTGNNQTWLWSPESAKWLSIAQDVNWKPAHDASLSGMSELIAFRQLMPSDSAFPHVDVAVLNRKALRWQPMTEGYIPRHRPAPVALADGRIMVIGGGSAITQIWSAKDNSWRTVAYTNAMLHAPKALALKDGRVMVVGLLEQDSRQAACELWAPGEDRWTECGRFTANTTDLRPDKMLLRYLDEKQVLWVEGSERAMVWDSDRGWTATRMTLPANNNIPLPGPDGAPFLNPIASVWNPRTDHWEDGADALLLAAHGMPGYREADGSVTAIWGDGRQIVRWDAGKRTLSTFQFPRGLSDVTLDAVAPTPDGCFLAWSNRLDSYRVWAPRAFVFNTQTRAWAESSKPLSLPANARAAAAGDGTFLIVGYPRNALLGGIGSVRIRTSCSGIESLDSPELLYLPTADVPAAASPAQSLPAHIPLPQKPQPTWFAQWRAEWATHWQALREHLGLTLIFGVVIVFLSLRYFIGRVGAYSSDPEIRSRVVKIDIAIVGVSLPVLATVLGVPSPLVQGLVGVVIAIVALVSARRLWDHSESLRDKVLSGASYTLSLTIALIVAGTYVGERFIHLFKFITDQS